MDVDAEWANMKDKMEEVEARREAEDDRPRRSTRSRRRPSRWQRSTWGARILAAVLLVIGGLWFAQSLWQGPAGDDAPEYRTVVTKHGERSHLQLADGSRVMLNVDSKLRLPTPFNDRHRTVELTGEAYFDVETDSARPFIVKTGDAAVRVRGTAFNVRGYPDEGTVQVAVTEGGVSFQPKAEAGDTTAVELNSGEVGWMDEANTMVHTQVVDVSPYIGWTEGRLVFDNTPLPKVARQLERWYGLEVRVQDPALDSLHLTANLKSQSMRDVLDVVAATFDIRYQIEQDTVTLRPGRDDP
jgi:ferric-dicitrate binding protein FerR (iron transport regulator)